MNILVDGRPFCATSAGITTVLRCVLESWSKQFKDDLLYVILPKKPMDNIASFIFPDNVIWLKAKSPLFLKLPNLVFLQLMTPYYLRKYSIDIYFSPIPSMPYLIPPRVKTLIIVHDVVNLEFKETMKFTNKLANSLLFDRTIKKACQLWAVSNYTKRKINEYYPQKRCKEIFVGSAADRNLFKKLYISDTDIRSIKEKYGIKDKFIIFVGSLEPRKNLPFLLEIIPEIYKETGIQLVVVGAKGWKNSAIKEKVMNDSFPKGSTVFCGYVSNEELVLLYNIANCFVSSSYNEGFGLPQLEAFLCGCPVVTSENSAMIEVSGNKDGGYLMKGYKKEKWIRKIIEVVNTKPQVNIEQFDCYDWNIVIKKLRTDVLSTL